MLLTGKRPHLMVKTKRLADRKSRYQCRRSDPIFYIPPADNKRWSRNWNKNIYPNDYCFHFWKYTFWQHQPRSRNYLNQNMREPKKHLPFWADSNGNGKLLRTSAFPLLYTSPGHTNTSAPVFFIVHKFTPLNKSNANQLFRRDQPLLSNLPRWQSQIKANSKVISS